MSGTLGSPSKHTVIGDVWIDVTLREAPDLSAEVTEHPVEQGADVTDHVRLKPLVLVIEGYVTNQPIELPQSHMNGAKVDPTGLEIEAEPGLPGLLSILPGISQGVAIVNAVASAVGGAPVEVRPLRKYKATVLHFSSRFDRVGAVQAALEQIVLNRKPVTIVTATHTYENVVLTNLHTERDTETGDGLQFGVTGQVISVVSSELVGGKPEPVKPRQVQSASKGKQQALPSTDNAGSLAANALGIP